MVKEENNNFITKSYLDRRLESMEVLADKRLKLLIEDSKKNLEVAMLDSKQHAKDLKTFFADSLIGIGEYVKSVDDKVAKIELDMTSVKDDISLIKNVLEEKASKKEVGELKKRVTTLEVKFA